MILADSPLTKRQKRSTSNALLKKSVSVFSAFVWILFLILISSTQGFAQDEKDNTGTNPANFSYDFRLITEMAELKDDGGSLLKHTAEFRWPLGRDIANLRRDEEGSLFYDMGKMFSMRFRANYQNLSVDDPSNDPFGTSEVSGIGDLDARLLGIEYASKRVVIAPGLEAFFDTASNDALGSGKNALGPVVFAVFPGILGGRSLFAPGYQYVFDIGGDDNRSDISRSQIDLYFVWQVAKGKNWFILDPQIILDHENSKEAATIEAEWGFMIAPKQGISGYVRPGAGVGAGPMTGTSSLPLSLYGDSNASHFKGAS
jgi:hypothetical protein